MSADNPQPVTARQVGRLLDAHSALLSRCRDTFARLPPSADLSNRVEHLRAVMVMEHDSLRALHDQLVANEWNARREARQPRAEKPTEAA